MSKRVLVVALLLAVAVGGGVADDRPKPARQARKQLEKEITVKVRLDYLLYLPKDYDRDRKTWPLLLFLHGGGQTGKDIDMVKKHGPPKLIEEGKEFPFLVVSPQARTLGWQPEALHALLDEVTAKYRVDRGRIWVTGLSMGGMGTWAVAASRPERFAALVPICGGGDPDDAKKLKDLPIWVFHGAKDRVVPARRSQEMVKALESAGAKKVKFTLYPDLEHDCWTETYNNPKLYDWLLAQKRPAEKPAEKPGKLERAPRGFDVRREGVPRGKVETVEYDSKATDGKRRMVVYLPPGYAKERKYPVLYLLHGLGGNETHWTRIGRANIILDNLLAEKKIVPMLVVMPNGSLGGRRRPGRSDLFEKDLLEAIIPHVESHFSVKADREGRAIAGLSMGGGQALRIGLRRLDTFAWVGGFSSALFGRPNLVRDPDEARKKLRLLWVSCGEDDSLLRGSEALHASLERMKVPHVWYLEPGGHTFAVWKNDLYLLSQKLFRDR